MFITSINSYEIYKITRFSSVYLDFRMKWELSAHLNYMLEMIVYNTNLSIFFLILLIL